MLLGLLNSPDAGANLLFSNSSLGLLRGLFFCDGAVERRYVPSASNRNQIEIEISSSFLFVFSSTGWKAVALRLLLFGK